MNITLGFIGILAILIVVAILGGPVFGFISPEDKSSIIAFVFGGGAGAGGVALWKQGPSPIVESRTETTKVETSKPPTD